MHQWLLTGHKVEEGQRAFFEKPTRHFFEEQLKRKNPGPALKEALIKRPSFSPDSEAMGLLLQKTMSCPCALSRQVAGAGAGAVSWLRMWWRQVAGAGAGAGCRAPLLVL